MSWKGNLLNMSSLVNQCNYRSLSHVGHRWHLIPRCSTSACLSVVMACVRLYTSACARVRVCLQLDFFSGLLILSVFHKWPNPGPQKPPPIYPFPLFFYDKSPFMRSSLPSRPIQPASNNSGVNEWLNGRVRWWRHELRRGDLGREKALLCAVTKA